MMEKRYQGSGAPAYSHAAELEQQIPLGKNTSVARGVNHGWFISLLQQMGAEHTEVSCHLSVQWLSSGEILKIVQDLHRAGLT